MSHIEYSARRAQRLLSVNRWLAALGWSLAGAAGLFIVAVGVDRSFALLPEAGRFYGWLALGLLGAALGASAIWTLVTREDLSTAAARLDKAAGLKERISSGLYCAASTDPFARAVVADAERASRGLSVRHHLPVKVPGSAPVAGATVLVALLVFLLFPTLDLAGKQEKRIEEVQKTDRVNRAKAAMKPLEKELEKLRELAPPTKEPEAALADAKLDSPTDLRREMMKRVDKMAEKIEQQASDSRLGQVNEFKQMMRKLADEKPVNSRANELSKALAKGDFKSAQEAVEAIKQELSKEAKTPEEKEKAEQLKADLQKLSDKLEQAAKEDRKMREDLAKAGLNQQEIQQAMQKMAQKDFEALAKQLAEKGMTQQQAQKVASELKKKCEASGAASKMAQNLAKAGAAQQGQMGDPAAMQGLQDAAQQLSEMESLEQELGQLKSAMAQLNGMKDRLGSNCSSCNGTGMKGDQPCSGCQGSGMKPGGGQGGTGSGMGSLGQGEGGIAPVEATNFNTAQKQVKVHTLPGAIISTQLIEDAQIKGEASKALNDLSIASEREVADDIEQGRVPRAYLNSVGEFFQHGAAAEPEK